MNLVFLGPPGAGKGTIAAVAKNALGVPHISTGDLFRENIKNETELGKEVKAILASGGLVPDSVTIKMVEERKNNKDVLTRKKIISLVNDILDDALLLGVEKNDINKILDGALNYFSKEEKQEEIEFGLKTYIKKKISQIIEKKASDKQEVINMFNKYINVRLIRANNADEAIRELSKVSNIMNNYKIFLNPDILIEILNKNNTLKSVSSIIRSNLIFKFSILLKSIFS